MEWRSQSAIRFARHSTIDINKYLFKAHSGRQETNIRVEIGSKETNIPK